MRHVSWNTCECPPDNLSRLACCPRNLIARKTNPGWTRRMQPRSLRDQAEDLSSGARILIVEARFYEDIADALLAGATRVVEKAGAVFDRISVPGSLEIVPAIALALDPAGRAGRLYDVVVVLACVILGETLILNIAPQ